MSRIYIKISRNVGYLEGTHAIKLFLFENFSNNAPLKIDNYLSRHLFDKFGSNVLSNSILEIAFKVQY